jgi:hypothetical protein
MISLEANRSLAPVTGHYPKKRHYGVYGGKGGNSTNLDYWLSDRISNSCLKNHPPHKNQRKNH